MTEKKTYLAVESQDSHRPKYQSAQKLHIYMDIWNEMNTCHDGKKIDSNGKVDDKTHHGRASTGQALTRANTISCQ